MTLKFKRRLEKEENYILQLNHLNVLQYYGADLDRSAILSDYLVKEVTILAHTIKTVHNARQLIDSLEGETPCSV